jgi:ABC-type sugar transport system ATPase subunit
MATIQLEHVSRVFARPVLSRFGDKNAAPPPAADDDTGSPRTEAGIVALDDINLTIQHGETLSVIGPSGCGKSTLLRVIAGLEPMSSGRVLYDRTDMAEVAPGERGIGIVFQSYALYPHMTSKGNLGFFFKMHKRDMEIDDRVRMTAQILGMDFDVLLGRMPSTLSAGQKQRVALGRCIVRDPKLILLDEPLSNLDAKLRVQTRGELKRLLRHFSVTGVYVTHDQIEAIALADRLAVMRWGRIEQVGSYWDVYQRPANRFVGSFVGSPPMNFLQAMIHSDTLEIAGVSGSLAKPGDRYLPLLPVTLGVRPEDIHLAPDDAQAIWLTVDAVEYLPSDHCYFVYSAIGDAKVTAQIKSEVAIHRGERIPVRLAFEKASYFDSASGERVA